MTSGNSEEGVTENGSDEREAGDVRSLEYARIRAQSVSRTLPQRRHSGHSVASERSVGEFRL